MLVLCILLELGFLKYSCVLSNEKLVVSPIHLRICSNISLRYAANHVKKNV